MCSGSRTPWGSHLGGEEYPADCRSYEEFFLPCRTGPEAAATGCGLEKTGKDVEGILQFARWVVGWWCGALGGGGVGR